MTPAADQHRFTYFKRFRMEVDLPTAPVVPVLPTGFSWLPWSPALHADHAEVLAASFQDEIDSAVFFSLSHRPGCSQLLHEIFGKPGFLPEATWLLVDPDGYPCGTIQGVRERTGLGSIQNVGILPGRRGLGLGTALVLRALRAFWDVGLGRAYLEVTAQNDGAVRLYQRLGFRRRKVVYKTVDRFTVLL